MQLPLALVHLGQGNSDNTFGYLLGFHALACCTCMLGLLAMMFIQKFMATEKG